ncbi:short chain dehydrogenase/reductase family oxidoreductase [Burkholderia pseudomallei]|nr:short chain dehydrogenase/reductase family oxidoreductase [Burkholderia pseudomallei]
MHTFNDKVALITGGGTGIGAAVARKFVEAGGGVVLLGRRRGSRSTRSRSRSAPPRSRSRATRPMRMTCAAR